MIQEQNIDYLIGEITYRPGVIFWIEWNSPLKDIQQLLDFTLHIMEMVPDSTTPEIQTQKHYVARLTLPTSCAMATVTEHIFRHFEKFEAHEASEWFRVNDKRHREPH